MMGRMAFLLVICLYLLSNTATATQWAYIGIGSNPKVLGYWHVYLDTDTVAKKDTTVTYWVLERYYHEADGIADQKSLHKIEAIVSNPRQRRQLEAYYYDASGREDFHDTTPGEFQPVRLPIHNQEIDFAVQCTKEESVK